jgi:hypothetical protein
MSNLLKKHSTSFELAEKMVGAAVDCALATLALVSDAVAGGASR